MRPWDLLRNAILGSRNILRSLRRAGLDCVVLPLGGSYPEWTRQPPSFPFPFRQLWRVTPDVSLARFRAVVEMIGNDKRVRGVVVRFDTVRADLSTLYSLRRSLLDLRSKGKRLIAWLPAAGLPEYYLASACDEVIFPESARLAVLGLRAEVMFLSDALALAGVEADLEAIAEYKVAPDLFRRTTMTEPHREMLDAIVNSLFDEIVAAIAEGRGLDPAGVRDLIDAAPLVPARAIDIGLADGVLYEDELAAHFAAGSRGAGQDNGDLPARLLTWREAAHRLQQPLKWTTRQRIGVVSLEGMIVPGQSRRVPAPVPLPFFEMQAGAGTIVQALRRAEADRGIAAVILHVETPGGSVLASDLICREVRRLRERKPVVVLMGGQATSGGYYVSALAHHIVARPTTLTGSIGIWGGKFVLAGLYAKLGLAREAVQRGAMADLYSEMTPFSDEERERVRRSLGESYTGFKKLVAEGRGMTVEGVEDVARGRVWTGAQALEVGLVDQLGDFDTALVMAKKLAGLDPEREYTVVQVRPSRRELLPPPSSTAALARNGLLDTLQSLAQERAWALAPWAIWVRG